MPEYGKSEYWDERYKANDTTFDWYVSFEPLREILTPLMRPESRILMIGCGNSRLSAQMYEAGYRNIVNIDICDVVVQQMRARYRDLEGMEWRTLDATKLDYPEDSFDLVIDKGTTDAILCGANSFHNVHAMNKGISKAMKKGAHYMVVTYGQPDTRIDHFRRKRLAWEVTHKTIDKPVFAAEAAPASSYHVYVMRKVDPPADDDEDEDDDDDDDDDFYDKFQAGTQMS